MSAIAVAGVSKAFGPVGVLHGLDLDVADGELLVLLGPSGCGKTTMLRLIAGLDPVDGGSIAIGDVEVSGPDIHIEPERRRVGMDFQNGALFPHLSAARNVGFGLERSQRRGGPRIDEMLGLVGMAELADRMPDALSGGQQQRVALARSLAPQPGVLLMDEPFSNLDAVLRTRLRREVRDVVRAAGVTTVFVTHDRDEAFTLGDRVAVMRDGVLCQVDRPEQLYERPVDRWVATFVGEADFLRGSFDGSHVTTSLGELVAADTSVPPGPVDVLVRPEHVELVGRAGADGGVHATIAAVEFSGPTSLVEVHLDHGEALRVRHLGPPDVAAGDSVGVRRRPGPVVVFATGENRGT